MHTCAKAPKHKLKNVIRNNGAYVGGSKFELFDMEVSLNFLANSGGMIFKMLLCLWLISNPKVPDERYDRHCLSNDTFWFIGVV